MDAIKNETRQHARTIEVTWYDRNGLRVREGGPLWDTAYGPPAAAPGDFRHAVVRLPIVTVGTVIR